jgi:hypothetical protein
MLFSRLHVHAVISCHEIHFLFEAYYVFVRVGVCVHAYVHV